MPARGGKRTLTRGTYAMIMGRRTALKAFIAMGAAFQFPSQASACRVGWDQNLFEASPAPDVLPGAQIIRVYFSNAGPDRDIWPASVANPNPDYNLPYTLIGVARIIRDGVERSPPFPVYAWVTSCSPFFGTQAGGVPAHVVEGEYYLIGRFRSGANGRLFYAGGLRRDLGGPIYQGWHF
jgi:hypothetical protein